MSGTGNVADLMRARALEFLAALDDRRRPQAALPFGDEAARRWLEYRPEPRPGVCLAGISPAARKAAHRLLATALSEHAFAQALAIVALEEVLDERERGRLRRHLGGYVVCVFGEPADHSQPWSWRFEGHHLSVTMTVLGDAVSPAPVFLGANPAVVAYHGRPVSRPLGPEEDLARELLSQLGPDGLGHAIVAAHAPGDIRSATSGRAAPLEPRGIAAASLPAPGQALLHELTGLYLERLTGALAAAELARVTASDLYFAWEGPDDDPAARHYYRIQGEDLLIEYDTTSDGNHAHSVLRRPAGDFGDDLLAAHHRALAHPA
jgi:uncharacterized protein DUF3500